MDNGVVFPASDGGFWVRQVQGDVINAQWFGANPNGSTITGTPIQAAINYANGIGGGKVYLPEGRYMTAGRINLRDNVQLEGDGDGTVLLQGAGDLVLSNTATVGTAYSFAIQPLMNVRFVRTTVASPFAPGDWVRIRDEGIWRGNSDLNKNGIIFRVMRVNGDSTFLNGPIPWNVVLETGVIEKITPLTNATVRNLRIENPIPDRLLAAMNSFEFAVNLRFDNVTFVGSDQAGLELKSV